MQYVYLNNQIFHLPSARYITAIYIYSFWEPFRVRCYSKLDLPSKGCEFVNRCFESRNWKEKYKVNSAGISEKIDSIDLYRHQNSPNI